MYSVPLIFTGMNYMHKILECRVPGTGALVEPLIVQYRAIAYSNNSSQDDSNGVDEVLRLWGVYKDPRTFTNVVSTGIDTKEKRNKLLGVKHSNITFLFV